ncbi:hypothetical protein GQ44DRAFT_554485, partial [Phaeosphaeriaceae sp. PMI808]
PLPGFSLEEALEICRICWEAAADACPPSYILRSVTSAKIGDTTKYVLKVALASNALELGSDWLPKSQLPREIEAALPRWNLCDWFAFLMEDKVHNVAATLFGASAKWVRIVPKPIFFLTFDNDLNGANVSHSVLWITTGSGVELVMDGTGEQFGWDLSTWLLPANDFRNTHMIGDAANIPDGGREEVDAEIGKKIHDQGFWRVVQERMDVLFDELDWDQLRKMTHTDRVKRVENQAKEMFEGAYSEA